MPDYLGPTDDATALDQFDHDRHSHEPAAVTVDDLLDLHLLVAHAERTSRYNTEYDDLDNARDRASDDVDLAYRRIQRAITAHNQLHGALARLTPAERATFDARTRQDRPARHRPSPRRRHLPDRRREHHPLVRLGHGAQRGPPMSAAELRQAAETLRDPIRCNTNTHDVAVADLLDRAAFLAFEAEHAARVVSDQAMTHIGPNYPPIVSDAVVVARLINGGAS